MASSACAGWTASWCPAASATVASRARFTPCSSLARTASRTSASASACKSTPHPVVGLITEWQTAAGNVEQRDEQSELGGTMRLGAQEILLADGSLAARTYGAGAIQERHRHRYEVNNNYRDTLEEAGLRFSGLSVDNLVEMVEIPGHPWFLASQFHPEFTSNPRDGHPLFKGFISAARQHHEGELPRVAEA